MGVIINHGSWWVEFRYRKQRVRRRSPHNSRRGALAHEQVLRTRLANGEPLDPNEKKGTLFATFALEWHRLYVVTNNKPSDQASKMSALRRHLIPAFGELELADITPPRIEEYKAEKLAAGLSQKTVNNHLNVLSGCLRRAVEAGDLERLPVIRRLKCESVRIDTLSDDEAEALLTRSRNQRGRLMILMGLRTGMRIGELSGLEWKDVDLVARRVVVRRSFTAGQMGTPKNNKTREIPISASLAEGLAQLRREDGLVFAGADGEVCSYTVARRLIANACRDAGIRPVTWHVLRHTFATKLNEIGVQLRTIQDLMGHGTILMTQRYAHVTGGSLRSAVDALESPTSTPVHTAPRLGMPRPADAQANLFSVPEMPETSVAGDDGAPAITG